MPSRSSYRYGYSTGKTLLNKRGSANLIWRRSSFTSTISPVNSAAAISRFASSDSPLINKRTYNFLRDLEGLATQATEAIEIYYTMVSDQQNSYNTNINNNVNDIMKVLTILSTIFIPLTFIAGIYGMNFEYIPELKYRNAYFILWGIMIVIAALMLLLFKRKKWF